MLNPTERLKKNLEASIQAKHQLLADAEHLSLFAKAVETVFDRYKQGGRIYIAGNGGSAADAHIR
jgi:D-sedoheptulose 7-phosphate isomerase